MLNKNITTIAASSYLAKLRLALAGCLLLFLFSGLCHAQDVAEPGISISNAQLKLQESTVVLNASIVYQLSTEATEALNSGITLPFNIELSLIQQRRWLWDIYLHTIHLPYQIKYHTLADTYQVTNLSTQRQQSFASLSAALFALGHLNDIPLHKLPASYLQQPDHIAKLSASLNIEALPLPMRPMAYITPAWYLSSSHQWPLP